AVRKLNQAGVPCGVLIAPVIPGLSDGDDQLREVVTAVAEAGAVSMSAIGLHLRAGVKEHFMAWLAGARPDLVDDFERRYRRAYLPKGAQELLAERVRRFIPKGWQPSVMPSPPRPPPPPRAPPAPAAEQLTPPSCAPVSATAGGR